MRGNLHRKHALSCFSKMCTNTCCYCVVICSHVQVSERMAIHKKCMFCNAFQKRVLISIRLALPIRLHSHLRVCECVATPTKNLHSVHILETRITLAFYYGDASAMRVCRAFLKCVAKFSVQVACRCKYSLSVNDTPIMVRSRMFCSTINMLQMCTEKTCDTL